MVPKSTVIAVVLLTAGLFLIFVIVAFATGSSFEREMGITATAARMEFAFAWTLRAVGSFLAILTTIQLYKLVGPDGQIDRIVPAGLALLGALLLVGQHWSVVIVFGVVALALIFQQLWLRRTTQPVITAPEVTIAPSVVPEPSPTAAPASAG